MTSTPGGYPAPPAWLAGIPGYSGYHAKEQRRLADRALREDLARRIGQSVQALQRLSAALAKARRFDELGPIDTVSRRLQLLVDRLRTSSDGYRALFDRERVDEAVLDQILQFDRSLASGVDRLATLTGALNERLSPPILASPAGQELEQAAELLHQRLDTRSTIIAEGQAVTAGKALEVLAEPPRPSPPPRYIKIGDALSVGQLDYIVDALINYAGARQWTEYRLRDGERECWLMVEPAGAWLLEPIAPTGLTPSGEMAVELAGRRYTQLHHGQSSATIGGPSGQRTGIPVTYHDYVAETGQRLVRRDWGDQQTVLHGEAIDSALIQVYARI